MRTRKKELDVAISYLSSLLRNVAHSKGPLVENTAGANEELQRIRDVFNSEWYVALSEFDEEMESLSGQTGDISDKRSELVSALQLAWASAISSAMARSFRRGYGARGRQDSSSLTYDRIVAGSPLFKRILDKHTAFANQFAQQYADGYTDQKGKMGVGSRSNMYGQALKSAYNAGAVFGGINDEQVWWRLGACEHCPDCIALASSGPFTMQTLPTVPGNGDTICKTNCCCHLTFVRGAKSIQPSSTFQAFMNAGQDGEVQEAEAEEKVVRNLQDLMLRRSFLRRVALASDEITAPEVRAANANADKITKQIDRISSIPSLKAASRYNPASVITKADISETDLEEIFMDGIDGASIFRADLTKPLSSLDEIIGTYERMPTRSSVIPNADREDNPFPKVGSFSTFNLVANGAAATFTMLRKLIEIMGETEVFIEVGGLGESLQKVVGFSGVWLRGQKDEVDMALRLLEDAEVEFAAGEVMFL